MHEPTAHSPLAPAFILSAGSEMTSVALADELLANKIPLIVVALGKQSLLRGVPGVIGAHQLPWPPEDTEATVSRLLEILASHGVEQPIPAFATDDGSLRFLVENQTALAEKLVTPGIPGLELAGLDKAELDELMIESGLESFLAPSMTCDSTDQIPEALERFGPDVVFKPALKTLDVTLPSAYCKIVTRNDDETVANMVKRLETAWPLSQRWIAQIRLEPHPEGEALFGGMRGSDGTIYGFTAFDRWKQPRLGGTGCWVETHEIPELAEAAATILERLELRGLAEVAFLLDGEGQWRMLEINPRAWLQVGLANACGLKIITATYFDALGKPIPPMARFVPGSSWASPERLLQSVFSADYGPWRRELVRAFSVVRNAKAVAVYSSRLPRVRFRWIIRCLRALVAR